MVVLSLPLLRRGGASVCVVDGYYTKVYRAAESLLPLSLGYYGEVNRPDVVGCINMAKAPETVYFPPGTKWKVTVNDIDGGIANLIAVGGYSGMSVLALKDKGSYTTTGGFTTGKTFFSGTLSVGATPVTGLSFSLYGSSPTRVPYNPFRLEVVVTPIL